MNVRDILAFATEKHAGQLRKDKTTPYINHPIDVCEMLFETGITEKPFTDTNLNEQDYIYYSTALAHDLLEDTGVTEEALSEVLSPELSRRVLTLTFRAEENNPFGKALYLSRIANNNDDVVFFVKCADRICNVRDFLSEGLFKYAKIYFHKADALWGSLYHRQPLREQMWKEVLTLNETLRGTGHGKKT